MDILLKTDLREEPDSTTCAKDFLTPLLVTSPFCPTFIHLGGMVTTPIRATLALEQKENREKGALKVPGFVNQDSNQFQENREVRSCT